MTDGQPLVGITGWSVTPTADGGIRIRQTFMRRLLRVLLPFPFVFLLFAGLTTKLLLFCTSLFATRLVTGWAQADRVLSQMRKEQGDVVSHWEMVVMVPLFCLFCIGLAGGLLWMVWEVIGREEWYVCQHSFEIRRQLLVFAWSLRYDTGGLVILPTKEDGEDRGLIGNHLPRRATGSLMLCSRGERRILVHDGSLSELRALGRLVSKRTGLATARRQQEVTSATSQKKRFLTRGNGS